MAGPRRYTPADRYIFNLPQEVGALAGADLVIARRVSDGVEVGLPFSNFASGPSLSAQLFGTSVSPLTWTTPQGPAQNSTAIYVASNDSFYLGTTSNILLRLNCTTGLVTEIAIAGTGGGDTTTVMPGYDTTNNRILCLCGTKVSAVNLATDAVTTVGTTASDSTNGGAGGKILVSGNYMWAFQPAFGKLFRWDLNGANELASANNFCGSLIAVSNGQLYTRALGTGLLRIVESSGGIGSANAGATAPGAGLGLVNPSDGTIWVPRSGSAPFGFDSYDLSTLIFNRNIALPGVSTFANTAIYDASTLLIYCQTNTNFIYSINASSGSIVNGFKTTAPSGSFIGINTTRRQLIDGSGTTSKRFAI